MKSDDVVAGTSIVVPAMPSGVFLSWQEIRSIGVLVPDDPREREIQTVRLEIARDLIRKLGLEASWSEIRDNGRTVCDRKHRHEAYDRILPVCLFCASAVSLQ